MIVRGVYGVLKIVTGHHYQGSTALLLDTESVDQSLIILASECSQGQGRMSGG